MVLFGLEVAGRLIVAIQSASPGFVLGPDGTGPRSLAASIVITSMMMGSIFIWFSCALLLGSVFLCIHRDRW